MWNRGGREGRKEGGQRERERKGKGVRREGNAPATGLGGGWRGETRRTLRAAEEEFSDGFAARRTLQDRRKRVSSTRRVGERDREKKGCTYIFMNPFPFPGSERRSLLALHPATVCSRRSAILNKKENVKMKRSVSSASTRLLSLSLFESTPRHFGLQVSRERGTSTTHRLLELVSYMLTEVVDQERA